MATEYRINMKRYNGTDYDIMYPRTLIEQVTDGQRQIIVDTVSIGTSWTGTGPYTQVITVGEADADSKVDIQPDATIIQKLIDAGTTALYIVNDNGVFSAVAIGSAPTESLTVQCTITKTVAPPPPPVISSVLNENSWDTIKWASKHNVGQNYWSVGDCKEVTMNGKVSDGLTLTNYTAWVFIIGFNHNAEREGNGITFQGFKATDKGTAVCLVDSKIGGSSTTGKFFNMNNERTNAGGWQTSQMRQNIMPLIKAAFPADLRAVIKTGNIFTAPGTENIELTASEDDVFLLAEFELFGESTYASIKEANYLKQYAYYSGGGRTASFRHNATGTAAPYAIRSPYTDYNAGFCFVGGGGATNWGSAVEVHGVSPCFKV